MAGCEINPTNKTALNPKANPVSSRAKNRERGVRASLQRPEPSRVKNQAIVAEKVRLEPRRVNRTRMPDKVN